MDTITIVCPNCRSRLSVQNAPDIRDKMLSCPICKFKAKVNKDGIPQETKKREGYDKPGVRRRAAIKEGKKNARKRDRANNRDRD